jgi:hypothetical protein
MKCTKICVHCTVQNTDYLCSKRIHTSTVQTYKAITKLTDTPQLVPGGLEAGGELPEHLRPDDQPAGPPPPPPSLIERRDKQFNAIQAKMKTSHLGKGGNGRPRSWRS